MAGWLSRLFGRGKAPERDEVTIEPSGDYAVQVVGESRFQRELEQISGGRTEDGVDCELAAALVLDGAGSFAVFLGQQRVGSLSRETADMLFAKLDEIGAQRDSVVRCGAVIRGGWWRDGGADVGMFGVRLDFGGLGG